MVKRIFGPERERERESSTRLEKTA